MRDRAGTWHLYVYDTQRGLWHIEDETHATHFASSGGNLYLLAEDGGIWIAGSVQDPPEEAAAEEAVSWMAEFADWYDDSPNKKGISKILVRLEVDEGAEARLYIQYDSGGTWEQVGHTLEANAKRSYYLPVIPRRADHYRLKLEGTGGCRIYGLTREYYDGSQLKSMPGRQ